MKDDNSVDYYRSGDPYRVAALAITRKARRRLIKDRNRERYQRQYARRKP